MRFKQRIPLQYETQDVKEAIPINWQSKIISQVKQPLQLVSVFEELYVSDYQL